MRALNMALLAALLIGLADSVYLTLVHFGAPLFCSQSGALDCSSVLGSRFSVILGVPTAVYGLVWVAVSLALLPLGGKKAVVQVWYFLGLGGVAYSLSSMAVLGQGCEYCLLLDAAMAASIVLAYKASRHARVLE